MYCKFSGEAGAFNVMSKLNYIFDTQKIMKFLSFLTLPTFKISMSHDVKYFYQLQFKTRKDQVHLKIHETRKSC